MDRLELLKLALGHAKDPRDALHLAQEMAAFVAGGPPAKPAPPPPEAKPAEPAPVRLAPQRPTSRAAKHWTAEEINKAARLLDEGASYSEVGRILGRPRGGVLKKFVAGEIPCKVRKKDPNMVLIGQLSALGRGQPLNGSAAKAP